MRWLNVAGCVVCAVLSGPAGASDVELPFAAVLQMPEAHQRLDTAIRLHFQGEPPLDVVERKGIGTSNRSTNGFGKSREEGCRWAALSALRELQADAKHYGANAVTGIRSLTSKGAPLAAHAYQCHTGAFVTRVELTGTYVKVKEQASAPAAAQPVEVK